jgi:hypothetical protein
MAWRSRPHRVVPRRAITREASEPVCSVLIAPLVEAGIMISRRVALRHWGKVKKTTV